MMKTIRQLAALILILAIGGAAYCQVPTSGGQTVVFQDGKTVTLRTSAKNADFFQWFRNGEPIQKATGETYHASIPGTYTVIAFNNASCSSEASAPVHLVLKTMLETLADLKIDKRSEIKNTQILEPYEYLVTVTNQGPDDAPFVKVSDILPDILQFDRSTPPAKGIAQYDDLTRKLEWRIDKLPVGATAELRFSVKAGESGVIRTSASVAAMSTDPNMEDNTATDQKEILDVKIPNIFTPNGDGTNDVFEIRGITKYAENKLTIVNRWGDMVYQKNNYQNDWDGNSLLDGTYFYILEVKTVTGSTKALKGYVTLARAIQ
ncbi:MAG TPA: gliding motility-associated C-terminal domain-containing protein [Sphingobacteriaceae bacterium]